MSNNPALELYRQVMTDLAEDKRVTEGDFEAAASFAKSSKCKAPRRGDDWACDLGSVVPVKTAATKKDAAVKIPAVKKLCSEAGCPKDSYSKGMCAQHYTAARRQDPAERAKANEASRRWREKKVAAAADAQVSE